MTEIKRVALIMAGNSGVGKSQLLNLMINENVFDSRLSCRSVTSSVETQTLNFDWEGKPHCVIAYNIPGLIEANSSNLERNKKEMEKAMNSTDAQVKLTTLFQENSQLQAFLR